MPCTWRRRREAPCPVARSPPIRFYGARQVPPEKQGLSSEHCNRQGGARRRDFDCRPSFPQRDRPPRQPDPRQCARLGLGRDRGRAARPQDPVYRAQSGRELSRHPRLDRELSRQRDAADDPLPARRGRGRDRARLRQGHRQGDGGGGALQRRPVPRHHGGVQRLVRPHAGRHPRRNRPGRRAQAPSLDRLDPHRARPGRDRPRLHQVGRPAGLAGRFARGAAARDLDRQYRRRRARSTSISTPSCRRRSSTEQLTPIDPARYMPQADTAPSAETVKKAAALLKGAKNIVILCGRTSRAASSAGTSAWRSPKALNAKVITDLKIGASFPTDHPLHACAPARQRDPARSAGGGEGRRRDPQPRLGRPRRRVQGDSSATSRRRRR